MLAPLTSCHVTSDLLVLLLSNFVVFMENRTIEVRQLKGSCLSSSQVRSGAVGRLGSGADCNANVMAEMREQFVFVPRFNSCSISKLTEKKKPKGIRKLYVHRNILF